MATMTGQVAPNTAAFNADSAYDDDMDIDIDIDLGLDAEEAALETDAMRTDANQPTGFTEPTDTYNTTFTHAPQDESALGPALNKVYVVGLDTLTTDDIKAFAAEHFTTDDFHRIEWIDDTSANIVYKTEEAGQQALIALSNVENRDPATVDVYEERPSKRLSSHPDITLRVRQATTADIKKKGARHESRFYLLNPEWDPEERKRNQRGGPDKGNYRKRRFDDRELKRRRNAAGGFDVDMYDDNAGDTTSENRSRRRDSYSSYSSDNNRRKRRQVNFRGRNGGDLFEDKMMRRSEGRIRDRSASPLGDGDGRFGFAEKTVARASRLRSFSPPSQRGRQGNAGIELFPAATTPVKELFPNKASPPRSAKELFPHKTDRSNHRRTDAFDAADNTSDIISPGSHRKSTSRDFPDHGSHRSSTSRDLADRITSGPFARRDEDESSGFTVRGSARANAGDFSIRGAALENGGAVKELFPLKNGNAGKELFAEKIRGRGGPRRKADSFF